VALYDQSLGKEADRRILIVGASDAAERIVRALQSAETRHARVMGVVVRAPSDTTTFSGLPVLGTTDYLLSLIEQHRIGEVIVTDESLERSSLLGLIANAAELSVRFHVATDYEDVVVSRIINEVAGIEPSLPQYNIARLRYRIVKRAVDLVFSSLMLTIGLPVVLLAVRNRTLAVSQLWQVLLGKCSIVGLYPAERLPALGKVGLTGLVQISNPTGLSPQVVRELNEYYVQRYSLTLDFDIMLRFVLRRISGPPAA